MIYDDGSEALHGTLYGCLFHVGAYHPDSDLNEMVKMDEFYLDRLTAIFLLFGLLLSELTEYVAKESKNESLKARSKAVFEQIVDTYKKADPEVVRKQPEEEEI